MAEDRQVKLPRTQRGGETIQPNVNSLGVWSAIEMSAAVKTKIVELNTFAKIERALQWGWTVRCLLLRVQFPVGGVEFTVEDVRLRDPEFDDDEFEVLTLQGWNEPTRVWGIKPAR